MDHYTDLPNNKELEMKDFVKKIVMLFFTLGARRKHLFFTVNNDKVIFAHNKVIHLANKTLEHTNPNKPLKPSTYYSYEAEE